MASTPKTPPTKRKAEPPSDAPSQKIIKDRIVELERRNKELESDCKMLEKWANKEVDWWKSAYDGTVADRDYYKQYAETQWSEERRRQKVKDDHAGRGPGGAIQALARICRKLHDTDFEDAQKCAIMELKARAPSTSSDGGKSGTKGTRHEDMIWKCWDLTKTHPMPSCHLPLATDCVDHNIRV